jgi:hypothetical protein
VFMAHLMIVQGELQSEMGVIHVIAEKVRDYSHWLGKIRIESRDFRKDRLLLNWYWTPILLHPLRQGFVHRWFGHALDKSLRDNMK